MHQQPKVNLLKRKKNQQLKDQRMRKEKRGLKKAKTRKKRKRSPPMLKMSLSLSMLS